MKLPSPVSQILDRLESNGFEAFVVGGCVRDSLLGIVPSDWDICTSAYPEDVQAVFPDHFVIPTGLKHGTVTVISGNMQVEITTYRRDGQYLDHRHPESVSFTPNIQEDLKRRDFTINAMAYSPKAGLIDYFHGKQHLENKLLCCVGNPATRFSEDSLRILRGIRFAARFNLTIEPHTSNAIHNCKYGLTSISAERILIEFKKILESPYPASVLYEYPDILSTIFPDINNSFTSDTSWKQFVNKLSSLPESFPLRFSALLDWCSQKGNSSEAINKTLKRLKPGKNTYQHVIHLTRLLPQPSPASLAETRRFAGKYGMELLEDLLVLKKNQFHASNINIQKYIEEIKEKKLCYNIEHLDISGKDLIAKGLSGPNIGAALQQALDAVIDGAVSNTKESLLNFLFS